MCVCVYVLVYLCVCVRVTPAHHAIAEANYDDDFGIPFGGVAMYFLLTSTADMHVQKRLDSMLEQIGEYIASDVKRAVDVGAYLERDRKSVV